MKFRLVVIIQYRVDPILFYRKEVKMLNKILVFAILFVIIFEVAMFITRVSYALQNNQSQCVVAKDTVMCVEMLKRLQK